MVGSQSTEKHGAISEFDFDGLLNSNPAARHAAEIAQAATAAGNLVRRLRVEHDMKQSDLAARIGSTQAHISELERGLSSNGPTLAMLVRILSEFKDKLVVESRNESARRQIKMISQAHISIGELAKRLSLEVESGDINHMLREFSSAKQDAKSNIFATILLDGLLRGVYLAMRLAIPGTRVDIMRIRQEIDSLSATQPSHV
jgi:transcriptional regulator with XRE-family HTH domain